MTNKKFNVIYEGPVLNRSGYGVTSDLAFHALKNYSLFNPLTVIPTTWGGCQARLNELPGDKEIKACFPRSQQLNQPHIHISNTIPYMAKPVGSIFNINFCAGVEVTECQDIFVQAANKWHLTIVPSQHTKNGYLNSKVKPTRPIEVLHWSADTHIFKIDAPQDDLVNAQMAAVKEPEAFLFVGQTFGQLFGDRKGMDELVKAFCEAFKSRPDKPALVLKTGGATYSNFDRDNILDRVKFLKSVVPDNDVSVYVIHGELTAAQMAALYSHPKIIANISFTHGEGYGLPLLEGSLSGKPTIASNWSGHTEFLDPQHSIMLEGKIEKIPDNLASEYWVKGCSWFTVDYEKAKEVMLRFYLDKEYRQEANRKAITLAKTNADKFNLTKFQYRLHKILDRYLIGI